jgi:hypothetical protein
VAATRLKPGQEQRVGIFDIVGRNSDSGYVGHVGLLRTGNTLAFNTHARVFHSGPPLEIGQLHASTGQPVLGEIPVHLVGWIDDLEIEEWSGIQAWIEDVRTRISPGLNPLTNYRIDPPFREVPDLITGRIINCEYSCVGFVMRCYEVGAGIVLLNHDPSVLPPVGPDVLRDIYGEVLDRIRQRPSTGTGLGLPGDGPWRIVLSGYVFHALNRPIDEIRAAPHVVGSIEEAAFP